MSRAQDRASVALMPFSEESVRYAFVRSFVRSCAHTGPEKVRMRDFLNNKTPHNNDGELLFLWSSTLTAFLHDPYPY